MPKQAKVILYSVDELDTNAKSVAIGALEDSAYNVSHDWWEQPIEHYHEMLSMVGFYATTIGFSMDQLDMNGAAFTGTFDSGDADYVRLLEEYPEVHALLINIKSPIPKLEARVTAELCRHKYSYRRKQSVKLADGVTIHDNPEYDADALEHELDNFRVDDWESVSHAMAAQELIQSRFDDAVVAEQDITDYLIKIKDVLCDYIYAGLVAEHTRLSSEDAIIETMRCEKMLFLVDGTRAPDFLADNAVDVLEFEDVMADGSIEQHGYQFAEDDNYVYTVADVSDFDIDSKGFEVCVTVVNDGEFITNAGFATEVEAKLWAAKYSLGER